MSRLGVLAIFGSLFVAWHFYAVILNHSIQVDLIEFDVRQLDAFWSDTMTSSLCDQYFLLRNICQKCQDKEKYVVHIILCNLVASQHNLNLVRVTLPK